VKPGQSKKLIKYSLERILDAELNEHLGYTRYSPKGKDTGNSRNGKTDKTLRNDNGKIDDGVPRDRNGSFDPVVVKKYERNFGPIEEKIISMYAKEILTKDILAHIR
jgi:putative transposase